MTRCLLSRGSRHSVQPGENFSVKQLQLSTEISHQHLLIIIGQSVSQSTPQIFGTICDVGESGEEKTWTIIFYNIDNLTLLKRIPAPEVEAPSMDLNVKFFKSGIYIESMMTAGDDARLVLVGCYRKNAKLSVIPRINSWLFLNFEAEKIGSFVFESQAGRPVARNKSNVNITRGWLLS